MGNNDSYESRLSSADEAVRHIRSGWRILVGSGCGEPQTLVKALVAQAGRLRDVEVVHLLTLGVADYVNMEHVGSFRHNAFFIGANVREAVREGRADYTPIFLSEIPELIMSGQRRVDAVLLRVTPPDRHGYCSMGIHVDIQKAAIDSAKVVIAELSPKMPRTLGDTIVHVSQLDHIVWNDQPLLELPVSKIDPTSLEIAGHVSRLISHGACLQIGIGTIPDAVLGLLGNKRNLGVHTEMFSDGLLPLLENGNINNSQKSLLTGKTVTSFVMGTQKLYDYVDDNPSVEFRPSNYVNDPRRIARNDNVVAINSAIQVDLTGQVCADSMGYNFYSGIGGQVDFIRGAAMSRGGKPIIALPSTAKEGTLSRIVPRLNEGAGVVTSRGDVHYVVTEYGVAHLHGKTIRERALALINIAHPSFRKELLEFVKGKQYVYADEAVWQQAKNPYPGDWESEETFGDTEFLVRPVRATDERMLQEFFYSHDRLTIYYRYLNAKKQLGHKEAAHMCCADYADRMAFGVFLRTGAAEKFVAIGRYDLDPRTNHAETAVVVGEEWRRRGIATFLLKRLAEYAESKGIDALISEILIDNVAMSCLHRKLGNELRSIPGANAYATLRRLSEEPRKRTSMPPPSLARAAE